MFPLSPQDLQTLIREQIEDAFKKFMSKEEDEFLPIKEVCKRIGVSAPTIHAWCKDGRLIKRKLPGSNQVRLNINEVLAAFKEIRPYQRIKR